MKGTLIRKDNKWFVKYHDTLTNTDKAIEVDKGSLENKDLSTYWVEGEEVKFGRCMIWTMVYARILNS